MRRTIITFALAAIIATPAAAQQLTLSFGDEGRVTIDATSVPVRTILTKWAELGGTKVVGAERVSGAPLTIKLTDVPESQALEIILRSVAGYMAAPRHSGTGASRYDRILILATSSVPAPAAANNPRQAAPNPNGMAGTQRFIPPPQRQPNEDDEPSSEDDANPPNPPVFTFPQPGQQPAGGFAQPGMPVNVPMINGQPMTTYNPTTGGQQGVQTINPATPAYQTPGATFGSPVPGMIQAPPPGQQAPMPPVQIVRPPGRQ